jgi:hypothetical protein
MRKLHPSDLLHHITVQLGSRRRVPSERATVASNPQQAHPVGPAVEQPVMPGAIRVHGQAIVRLFL